MMKLAWRTFLVAFLLIVAYGQLMAQSGPVMGMSQSDMGTRSSEMTYSSGTYAHTSDYRSMSNEELNRMLAPANSKDLTPEERTELRREFERRIPSFTPEERQRYLL